MVSVDVKTFATCGLSYMLAFIYFFAHPTSVSLIQNVEHNICENSHIVAQWFHLRYHAFKKDILKKVSCFDDSSVIDNCLFSIGDVRLAELLNLPRVTNLPGTQKLAGTASICFMLRARNSTVFLCQARDI
ncbi:hypothetical protein BO71DRAFT_436024 [Aspergillus ellipticus CBS 707.79]|uniref:Uncharacterized protein n=1 Tax=Aspergillus ellipticus CBS 707.79 TaxID=1448320 RepID=A0A319CS56_9EURO|nr:hypothetical protein BO71DRAFT_436024 [Aspergillus ellipticus CBS 707.79]